MPKAMANIGIKWIHVLLTDMCDIVYLTADVPLAFPTMGHETSLKMETENGYGIEWVRKTFMCDPDEITDTRRSR